MGEEVQDAGHVSCLSTIHRPLPTTHVARSLIGPFDDTLNRLVTLISHCGARLHSRFFHFSAATCFTDFRLLATAPGFGLGAPSAHGRHWRHSDPSSLAERVILGPLQRGFLCLHNYLSLISG